MRKGRHPLVRREPQDGHARVCVPVVRVHYPQPRGRGGAVDQVLRCDGNGVDLWRGAWMEKWLMHVLVCGADATAVQQLLG